MAILIPDMEMPKNCIECPFMALANTTDGRLLEFCSVIEMFVLGIETQKDPKCPLVELPPHGRLIDVDAFSEFVRKTWADCDQWILGYLESCNTIIEAEEDDG